MRLWESTPLQCQPNCHCMQVLSRDIRSVHQRINVGPSVLTPVAAAAAQQPSCGSQGEVPAAAGGPRPTAPGQPPTPPTSAQREHDTGAMEVRPPKSNGCRGAGVYHVVLESIYVGYDVTADGEVVVQGAWVDEATAAPPR
jgi:hypothetical protein